MSRKLKVNDDYEITMVGEIKMKEIKRFAIGEIYGVEQVFSSNLSTEYSILIQNAGRWCERFASDVLVSINAVEKQIQNAAEDWQDNLRPEESVEFSHLFGFRKDGVDHKEFIESRIKDYKHYGDYYRRIYELLIQIEMDDTGRYLTVNAGFAKVDY